MFVWDKDASRASRFTSDLIDEFNFNLTDAEGSDPRLITIDGLRHKQKTR